MLEDKAIIALYWARDSLAITETDCKYGSYCRSISFRILNSREDSEECVNDTWLRTWDTIPPQKPDSLSAYLGRIVRNLSLDRYRYVHAAKRNAEIDPLLSEMDDCIPDSFRTEDALIGKELTEALNRFLERLPEKKRIVFMRRYWYACSIQDIAEQMHTSESQVKSLLFRLRNELRSYLEKEGYAV